MERDMNNAITVRHAFPSRIPIPPRAESQPQRLRSKGNRDRNICGTLDTTGIGQASGKAGGIGNGSVVGHVQPGTDHGLSVQDEVSAS